MSGSIAAGYILSLISAITISTAIGPVFRTVAIISESMNSTFSIDISGNTTPNPISSEPGPKTYPIITANRTKGMMTLTAVFALDDLLTSISVSFYV